MARRKKEAAAEMQTMVEETTKKSAEGAEAAIEAETVTTAEETPAEAEKEARTEAEMQAEKEAPKLPEYAQMVVEQKAPPVKILYVDSAIPNNQIPIGNGRYITGSGRVFSVPLEQFEGEFMTPLVMHLIDVRKFIVLSGLNDEQRMQYNCLYREREVIRGEGVFDSLLELPVQKAAEVFEELCPEHRKLVAVRFAGAYFDRHDNRISRERAEALNAISREKDGGDGAFAEIVRDINGKM